MDCSPPGFSIHGILQPKTLEWVAIPLALGEKDEKPQTGSQDSPEEPCLAVRYGLPRARPFLPAKGTSEGNEQRPGAQ